MVVKDKKQKKYSHFLFYTLFDFNIRKSQKFLKQKFPYQEIFV